MKKERLNLSVPEGCTISFQGVYIILQVGKLRPVRVGLPKVTPQT